MKALWICILLLICWGGCQSIPQQKRYPPKIKLVSIGPKILHSYQDSLEIVIQYLDKDGDLGENKAGVHNVFVVDSRSRTSSQFRLRQLLQDSMQVAVKGELHILLDAVGLINSEEKVEQVHYEIFIKDRSGHKSNVLKTKAITIVP